MPTTDPAPEPLESPFTTGIRKALRKAYTVREESLLICLDGARVQNLAIMLREMKIEHLPLFRESPQENIIHVTPFIARFSPSDVFLHWMTLHPVVLESALFCTSTATLQDTFHHVRRFLLTKDDTGRQVYFRFWDPRVIEPFLKGATPEERRWFCGPIRSLFYFDKPKYEGEGKMQFLTWRMTPEQAALPLKPLPDVHHPFQFRPEHVRVFEHTVSSSYDQRLAQYLKEQYPDRLASAKPDEMQKLVTQARQEGPKLGLETGREITHFAELLVLGLDDPRRESIRALPVKGRTDALVAMVEEAKKK